MRYSSALLVVFVVLFTYVCAQEETASEKKSKYAYLRKWVQNAMLNGMNARSRQSWKNRKGCYKDDEKMLPQRLLDWFHILKSEELKKTGKHDNSEFQTSGCNSIALPWFFSQLDTNKDSFLDKDERAELENNPDEHCMRKFFINCDLNNDKKLSLNELCTCFMHVEPPCKQAKKEYLEQEPMLGRYEPDCDEDGYYKPRQCHENYCWCVDRYNEVIEGTKKESRLVNCLDNTDPNQIIFAGDDEAAQLGNI
ncbi:testican-3-like [Dendronephthya gigantea]|uniref:testican-3-like n=1 Tax=Dendronephthya gigantea TaxID=151771 RepID=UPI00106D5AEC|nr:testican-3-like [Dendronephthya gigantea]